MYKCNIVKMSDWQNTTLIWRKYFYLSSNDSSKSFNREVSSTRDTVDIDMLSLGASIK